MNTRIPAVSNIPTELLLEVFDLPVSFHRCLVPVTGGVTAALMLSQAIWTTQEIDHTANGWFAKSQEQWAEATVLTRWEQETARRALRIVGFLGERRICMSPKRWVLRRPERVGLAWQSLHGAVRL